MNGQQFAQVMGAHRMFPNQAAKAGTPAINEPHEAHPTSPSSAGPKICPGLSMPRASRPSRTTATAIIPSRS